MSEVKKFMKLPAVIEATGRVRASIYKDMKSGTFPASIRIGIRAVAWDADDIVKWQKERVAQRDIPPKSTE